MQANEKGEIDYDKTKPSSSLAKNIKAFKTFFDGDETVKYRLCADDRCCVIFMDGMVDSDMISHYIIQPLQLYASKYSEDGNLLDKTLVGEKSTTEKYSKAVEGLIRGDAVLMQSGFKELCIFSTRGFPIRGIAEPDNEKALWGPREGFTESLLQNTSMLRRRLSTSDLKFQFLTVSKRTNSRACLCYLDSLVNRGILVELRRRLDKLDVDSFMDTYAINERIRDHQHSLFNTIGKTERPDTAASKILDGGVVLMLDGSPVALLVPFLFKENIKSRDDNYLGFYYASISRLLRYLAFLVTISAGAVYISVVNFHIEMLPVSFMLAISVATSGLPMPTFMEFILLMLVFEMLREAGVRMSSKMGQSLSIVGALVIGQAAVEARLISAPMVIVVASAAITGLMIPTLSSTVIVIRLAAVIGASLFGFYGYSLVMLGLAVHLFSLESFGIQYTGGLLSTSRNDLMDTYIRPPSPEMKRRSKFVARDRKRSG